MSEETVTVSREELLYARECAKLLCYEAAERGDRAAAKKYLAIATDLFEILTKDHQNPERVAACLLRSRALIL
jgi:hypothetical protein